MAQESYIFDSLVVSDDDNDSIDSEDAVELLSDEEEIDRRTEAEATLTSDCDLRLRKRQKLEIRSIRVSCDCRLRDKKRIKKGFSKYGQIVEIHIREAPNRPQCLITFATVAEARKAYRRGCKLVIAGVNDESHPFAITLERTEVQVCFDSDNADLQEPLPVSPKVIIGEVIQRIYGYQDTHRWYIRIMRKIMLCKTALEFQSMMRSPVLINAAVITAHNEVVLESRNYWKSFGRG